jgi:RNA polymerase sigma factor (sigma-70 family)
VSTPGLVEHFFRRDYGRLVAILTRRVGMRHVELVEDAVQRALLAALTAWTKGDVPLDPRGWLYKVAYRQVIQDLRRAADRAGTLQRAAADFLHQHDDPLPPLANEIRDDMLRMLFICCDEVIPRESQLVLALKVLCGFSTAEISLRLFISEANVHKRLSRARDRLRQTSPDLDVPPLEALQPRLTGVHTVLYLLFNEGYLSANPDQAIRRELCDEAVRLANLVAEHPVGAVPESFALLALMYFHVARLSSRLDGAGELLLLEEQDRSSWDRECIRLGMQWLERSAHGDVFSRFHAEAGIAAEHCLAPSYEETRWREIAELYGMLERIAPSPLHSLNRAVAVAEWQGPGKALGLLEQLAAPAWLADSYLWQAVLGDLHRRAGHLDIARVYREGALSSVPTMAMRNALRRRLAGLDEMGA